VPAPKPASTIAQALDAFLVDQKPRLSPKTYARYDSIIDLYKSYLERYWPGHDGEYDAVTKAGGTYCGTFGPEEIPQGSPCSLTTSCPARSSPATRP